MLAQALQQLEPEITIITQSQIYETPPWGYTNQPAFLNQVILANTSLSAQDLLSRLKNIEQDMGRKPNFRYGPRVIDLDILFFNDEVIQDDNLVIPHPEMTNRAFVLIPMREIAPDFEHPVRKKTIKELAEMVNSDDMQIFSEKIGSKYD